MSPTAWILVGLLSLTGTGTAAAARARLVRRRKTGVEEVAPAAEPDLVEEALTAQLAHEAAHPVVYTAHQRRRAVLRRAQELAHLSGRPAPADLATAVARAVPLK